MWFLTEEELNGIGLKSHGSKVLVDKTVRFVNPERISIGDNVRIDFSSLISAGSDGIEIGSHIHIGSSSQIFGTGGKVSLHDFSGLSPSAMLFTATDDFVYGYLRGPQFDARFRKCTVGEICLYENAVVGANSVVLPSVSFGFNSCAGALTVVSSDVQENVLVVGNPARVVKRRDGALATRLIAEFREEWKKRSAT